MGHKSKATKKNKANKVNRKEIKRVYSGQQHTGLKYSYRQSKDVVFVPTDLCDTFEQQDRGQWGGRAHYRNGPIRAGDQLVKNNHS